MATIKQIKIGTSTYDIGAEYTSDGSRIRDELNGKISRTGQEDCSDLKLTINSGRIDIAETRDDNSEDTIRIRPGTTTGAIVGYYKKAADATDSTQVNYLQLTDTQSILRQPLIVGSGGTGGTTPEEARANLGVALANRIEGVYGSLRAISDTYSSEQAVYLLGFDLNDKKVAENATPHFVLGSPSAPFRRTYALCNTLVRTVNNASYTSDLYIGNETGNTILQTYKDGSAVNYLSLQAEATALGKPLAIGSGGTGGTTRLEAADNLRFSSLTQGTSLADGTNLDNITTPGSYYNSSNDNTYTNCPTTNLFDLTVGCLRNHSTYMYQKIVTNKSGKTYYRSKQGASASWSDWYVMTPGEYLPLSGGTVTGATKFNSTVTIGSAKFTYDSTNKVLKLSFV